MTERVKSGLTWRGLETDYGGASEALSDERDGTDRLHLRNTAPVLDPTKHPKSIARESSRFEFSLHPFRKPYPSKSCRVRRALAS